MVTQETKSISPSDKQQAIYDMWENTDNNMLIQAVAGSGKTTTLMHILGMCKWKTLYIAFNKSIQVSTEEKMQSLGYSQGRAMTLHSLGLHAIKYINPKVEIDNNVRWDILKEVANRQPFYFSMKSYSTNSEGVEVKLFSNYEEIMRLKFTLLDMNDTSRNYLTNDPDEIIQYLLDMDKSVYENPGINIGDLWETFIEVREEFYSKAHLKIDFTDMIFLPARGDYYIPFDPYYLLLDECQDFNLAQHKLIDNFINQGDIHKWIAVGDRNQSIYGFTGAYPESFDLFKNKPNVVEMPLDICYRCPVDVIDSANNVYPVLIPFKKDRGIVKTITNKVNLLAKKPGSMVICRNKSPLIELYFDLVEEGIPCILSGDDIMGSVSRFLGSYKHLSIGVAKKEIEQEVIELNSNLDTENKKIRLAILQENQKNFLILHSRLGFLYHQPVTELIDKFKTMFKGVDNSVILCTIHKSKGLEADTVFILNEFLIPSRFANSPQQMQQEQNLKYVARTRAKKEMYFLNIVNEN